MDISVSFTFQADTIEEAKEVVATWKVSPGVTLLGLQGTVPGNARPVEIAMGGTIGGALLVTGQQPLYSDLPPQPPPSSPPQRTAPPPKEE